jgi:hypothetical protein
MCICNPSQRKRMSASRRLSALTSSDCQGASDSSRCIEKMHIHADIQDEQHRLLCKAHMYFVREPHLVHDVGQHSLKQAHIVHHPEILSLPGHDHRLGF